ncbi:MAG: peptidoglycan DD-metalloendopeptidase family protein [Caulobacteraceae bacterium]
MIHLKKAMVKTKNNFATFMYIPESQSTVRSYRIPIWFPKFVTLSILLLVAASVICLSLLSSLKVQHEASKKEIVRLTAINNTQKGEIEKLKKDSAEVQKQLEANSKILEEVKKAVGISPSKKEESTKSGEGNISSSNSNAAAKLSSTKSQPDMSNEIKSIGSDFTTLSQKIASQKQEIEKSMGSIKSKLAYLLAKPSIVPVSANITGGFGYRRNPFTSRGSEFHRGIDFGASYGQTVVSTGDGVVIFAGWNSGYGRTVIISHGYGLTTLYGHNSKLLVKQGDKVKKGQAISKVGNTGRSTGTHLHYEVKLNGKNVNPAKYFQ